MSSSELTARSFADHFGDDIAYDPLRVGPHRRLRQPRHDRLINSLPPAAAALAWGRWDRQALGQVSSAAVGLPISS